MNAASDLYLIVGLGNPGPEYEKTRHNAGFLAIDEYLKTYHGGTNLQVSRRFSALTSDKLHDGQSDVILCKPNTFMNLSGSAVGALAAYYQLKPEQILVVHDELDLPFGTARLKFGGGLAGHHGLMSIAQALGDKHFYRLRIGIKSELREFQSGADFVLSRFSKSETSILQSSLLPTFASGIHDFLTQTPQAAMMHFNQES